VSSIAYDEEILSPIAGASEKDCVAAGQICRAAVADSNTSFRKSSFRLRKEQEEFQAKSALLIRF
jgi:hypothetical protein